MNYLLIIFLIFTLFLMVFREWFIRKRPSPRKVKQLQQLASKAIILREWKAAKKHLKALIKKRLDYPETLFIYVRLLRGLKLFDKALALIEGESQHFNNHPQLHLLRGKILLDLQLPNGALEAFNKCLPQVVAEEDLLDYYQALLQSGEVSKAWDKISLSLKEKGSERLYLLAGDCQYVKQNYVQAILYYEQAQESGEHSIDTLFNLARCFVELKHYQKAENILFNIIEKDPLTVEYTLCLGRCFEEQALYRKALELYQGDTIWNYGHSKVIRQAGMCALYLKEFEFAECYFQETLKRGQVTPQNLAFLGYAVECQHRWQEAESIYKYMIKKFPTYPGGYRALAWLFGVGLSQKLEEEVGLSLAQRALELLPDATSWEILSACEARAGNFSKAHTIQEQLSSQTKDLSIRRQRRHNMRTLRKKIPLDKTHIIHTLVA